MRVKPWLLMALMLFEGFGLAAYLLLLGEQSPVNLSVFCSADVQVIASGKNVYSLFLVGTVLFGTAFFAGENSGGMSVVLWQSKRRLLERQGMFCAVWSLLVAAIAVLVPLILADTWGKTEINWGSSSSYFAIINHAVLPKVQLWEVVLVNFLTQWARNMIFSAMVLLSYWWNGNLLYGILAATGICFVEMKMPQIGMLLGLVKADYEFWLSDVKKLFAVAAGIGWLCVTGGALYYLQKGKEFI